MTTTTERLLQLAAEHEQKAQALRLAAAELNGHQTMKKREELPKQLQAAITLRETQRPRKRPKPKKQPSRHKGELRDAVLGFLGTGSRTKEEVTAFLRELAAPSQGLGALFRYGYIKMTRRGIAATAKGAGAAVRNARERRRSQPARPARRASPEATWKRAHALLQVQGPMRWSQLRDALGLAKSSNVSGAMYEHPEALVTDNGLWSAKA